MTNMLVFSIFVAASLFIYWCLQSARWRSLFLFVSSLFFVASVNMQYAFYFLLNIILVYIAGIFIDREYKAKKLLLKLTLVWLIVNLCFFKYANILLGAVSKANFHFLWTPKIKLPNALLPIGLSYIIFRLIHYIVEVYRKNIPRSSFADFASYVLFFPTFLAGPIERFPRFQAQTAEDRHFDISDANYGLYRIIRGIIKKCIIADSLARIVMPVLHYPQYCTRTIIILSIYALAIRVYMDFSGYTDIAVGIARLFGYRIMENFNKPFFQSNIALFWRNWHISLYIFIRDYLFYPVFGYHTSKFKIYSGLFLTFLAFNLWHRLSLDFFISGIYFGLGLITWYAFQDIKRRVPIVRKIAARPYLNLFSIFLTFNFVAFGFSFFAFGPGKILAVIQGVF